MLLVYLTDGDCLEIENATRVERTMGMLLCYDANGYIVRAIDADEVTMFTLDDQTAQLIRDEACDEVQQV